MSRIGPIYGLGRQFEGSAIRHQRAGEALASWIMEQTDKGLTTMRVKAGPLGVLDTPYSSQAYTAAASNLTQNGIEIEAHRYSKDSKLAKMFGMQFFDVIYVQEEVTSINRPQPREIPGYVGTLYVAATNES